MASIRHTLLDGRISELLPKDEGSRFPIICFLQTDTIGFVLRQFASETLMSALVLKSSARPDDPADDLDRSFSQILMRDILGFVDLHTILSSLLRGAVSTLIVHQQQHAQSAPLHVPSHDGPSPEPASRLRNGHGRSFVSAVSLDPQAAVAFGLHSSLSSLLSPTSSAAHPARATHSVARCSRTPGAGPPRPWTPPCCTVYSCPLRTATPRPTLQAPSRAPWWTTMPRAWRPWPRGFARARSLRFFSMPARRTTASCHRTGRCGAIARRPSTPSSSARPLPTVLLLCDLCARTLSPRSAMLRLVARALYAQPVVLIVPVAHSVERGYLLRLRRRHHNVLLTG